MEQVGWEGGEEQLCETRADEGGALGGWRGVGRRGAQLCEICVGWGGDGATHDECFCFVHLERAQHLAQPAHVTLSRSCLDRIFEVGSFLWGWKSKEVIVLSSVQPD